LTTYFGQMKMPQNVNYTEELLREAMEMLADQTGNMGMFQRQRYGRLRKRFDDHQSINKELREALEGIKTNNVC
jgi:hypothetical protein